MKTRYIQHELGNNKRKGSAVYIVHENFNRVNIRKLKRNHLDQIIEIKDL